MQRHPELRIQVQKLRNRYVAVTTDSHGKELLRHEFQQATGHLSHLGPQWLVEPDHLPQKAESRRGRSKPDSAPATQISLQGEHLFRYLFGEGRELRRYLATYLRPTETGPEKPAPHDLQVDSGIQIHLSFDRDAARLRRLPWEYLFDGKRFLCRDGAIMLSRAPSTTATPQTESVRSSSRGAGPLRMLLVIAAPTDQVDFDVEQELGIIQDALAPLITRQAVVLDLLVEPTLNGLRDMLQKAPYQLVHYVGHAHYDLSQHQGYLCFEDEFGHCAPTSGDQLFRFIHRTTDPISRGTAEPTPPSSLTAPGPHMLIISACQRAQVGIFDALHSVSNTLLEHGLSCILSMPAALRPAAARAFYRALFSALADGKTAAAALSDGRRTLHEVNSGSSTAQRKQRFAWGLPILHQTESAISLVTPQKNAPSESPKAQSLNAGPVPSDLELATLLGHRREIQAVRQALSADARIFYILGSHGIGKHAFASYLVDHLGQKVEACLRINCRDMITPFLCLPQIAELWRNDVAASDPDLDIGKAATQLMDIHLAPRERARQALAQLANKRILILFEEIDAWFTSPEGESGDLENTIIRDILLGLMEQPSRSIFLFTGSRRWSALAEIPMNQQRELHLPLLSKRYALQLMTYLPALRTKAVTLKEKLTVYRLVGGHPQTYQYIDRWLNYRHTLSELPALKSEVTPWLEVLIQELLRALDPGEYQALQALSILALPFSAVTAASLTRVAREQAPSLIERWWKMGLVRSAHEHSGGDPRYRLDAAVRTYVLSQLNPSELVHLHQQAADAYGARFYDAARRQILARTITTWSEERIGWLARDANGILGLWLRQEADAEKKARLIEEALAWEYHLEAIGETQAAAQIIQTLAPELKRQGQLEFARELLQRSLTLPTNPRSDQKLDTLIGLRLEERSPTMALRAYKKAYESLDPETETLQRAKVMLRVGRIYQSLENIDDAIQHYETALRIIRGRGRPADTADVSPNRTSKEPTPPSDRDAGATQIEPMTTEEALAVEAEGLKHLAVAYRLTDALTQALVCSQAAKEHYAVLNDVREQAYLEYEQGLILKLMNRNESALKCFITSLQFYRQVGDARRITTNLLEIGQLFDAAGKTDTAIEVIEEALERHDYLKNPEHGALLSLLEALYTKQRRRAEAITRFRASRNKPPTDR